MTGAGGLPPPGMGLAGGAQLTQAQWNRATMLKNNLMAAIQSVTGTLSNLVTTLGTATTTDSTHCS